VSEPAKLYSLGSQSAQTADPPGLIFPAGHTEQLADPELGATDPGGHDEQKVEAVPLNEIFEMEAKGL